MSTNQNQSLIQFEKTHHFEDDDEDDTPDTIWQNFARKFKEQPLVPLGAGATTIALVGAARAIQRGESSAFNRWCRYRIVFQGLTLVAALGGTLYYNQEKIQRDRADAAERERQRIRQRDLRIQSQELSIALKSEPSLPQEAQQNSSANPLFNNQNQSIRKALLDRKLADHHKSIENSPDPSKK